MIEKDRNRDHLWMAYLDDELNATEASAFEASLSEAERKRASAEKRFENRLGDSLGDAPDCPDTLWRKQLQLMEEAPRRRPLHFLVPLAAAALILVVGGVAWLQWPNGTAYTPMDSVVAMRAGSVTDSSPEAVARFAAEQGFDVDVAALANAGAAAHHKVALLGARPGPVGDDSLEILASCCGQPMSVFVFKSDAAATEALRDVDSKGMVRAREVTDRYVTAVVGNHPSEEITARLPALFPAIS